MLSQVMLQDVRFGLRMPIPNPEATAHAVLPVTAYLPARSAPRLSPSSAVHTSKDRAVSYIHADIPACGPGDFSVCPACRSGAAQRQNRHYGLGHTHGASY